MGFAPHNIYGYEIDPKAAQIARRRIYELTGVRSRNIKCGDFLESAQSIRQRFDYCVTNPPWGRKISRRERGAVTARYGARLSEDTSSIFLRAALCVVRDGGVVSFLVQEALFTVRTFESIRRYLFNYEVINLIDHGRVFPSLITRAVSVTLRKAPATRAAIECRIIGNSDANSGEVVMRSRESFACNPNLIYNIWAKAEDVELIERLYKSKYITLSGNARWGLGVVTGNNQRYLSPSAKSGFEPVIGGADILPEAEGRWGVGRLRSESRYIDSDLTRYQQVAAIDIYRAAEKLIYKFISNRLSFALDTTGCITLNSANILIPNSDFPLSARQLAALLNSEVMNRVYRAIFHANKVLRGDLEQLPLLTKYFEQNEEFDEKRYERWLKVELGYNIT